MSTRFDCRAGSPNPAFEGGPASLRAEAGSAIPPYRKWLPRALVILVVTLLPKCLLCVAGYVALAAGLTTAVPELCGETPAGHATAAWAGGLLAVATALVLWIWRGPVSGSRRTVR